MKRSKKYCQRAHARRRLRERFNIELTKDLRRSFIRMIRNGEAVFRRRESCHLTHWVVEHEGRKLPLVYDSRRREIVTFLPAPAQPVPSGPMTPLDL